MQDLGLGLCGGFLLRKNCLSRKSCRSRLNYGFLSCSTVGGFLHHLMKKKFLYITDSKGNLIRIRDILHSPFFQTAV